MTFGLALLVLPRNLLKYLVFVMMASGLAACHDEEIRGVFVAKFMDGSARFVKRIAFAAVDGSALNLDLATKSKHCELIVPLPAGARAGVGDCKDISGIASLRCEGEPELATLWQMTSCHSGYGLGMAGAVPSFLFGFSGNAYTAQSQLELAMAAKSEIPVSDCAASMRPGFSGGCNPHGLLSVSQLLDLGTGAKLP